MKALDTFLETVNGVLVATASIHAGRSDVKKWVNYRPERAVRLMTEAIAPAVIDRNAPLLQGMLQEFGEQIAASDTWEFQQETNALLWQFKEALRAELAASGLTIDEFLRGGVSRADPASAMTA